MINQEWYNVLIMFIHKPVTVQHCEISIKSSGVQRVLSLYNDSNTIRTKQCHFPPYISLETNCGKFKKRLPKLLVQACRNLLLSASNVSLSLRPYIAGMVEEKFILCTRDCSKCYVSGGKGKSISCMYIMSNWYNTVWVLVIIIAPRHSKFKRWAPSFPIFESIQVFRSCERLWRNVLF